MMILLTAVVALVLAAAHPAYAYLDPGTGSYFLQILAAGILGALLSLKLFWGRVKGFLKNLFHHREQ